MSEFQIGDVVRFGNGKEPLKVVAVITTGRVTTYDVRSMRRKRQCVGVPEPKLNTYEGAQR